MNLSASYSEGVLFSLALCEAYQHLCPISPQFLDKIAHMGFKVKVNHWLPGQEKWKLDPQVTEEVGYSGCWQLGLEHLAKTQEVKN